MSSSNSIAFRWFCAVTLSLTLLLVPLVPATAAAQDTVTGAFAGVVSERGSRPARYIANARIVILNIENGVRYVRRSDASGRFFQGALQPGTYLITVEAEGYQTQSLRQQLLATKANEVQPLPVELVPVSVAPATPTSPITTPSPTTTTTPAPTTSTSPAPIRTMPTPATATPPIDPTLATAAATDDDEDEGIREEINRTDGRRSGAYTEREVSTLPLGATTLVRTFDELALLLPGVAMPPYTLGNVAGPGVGAGVGSAGQFAVNGLPPRANNFTVDGSDNNDEDIGVRRQGFLALVPQPIESIREYQVITLLAPAQFGRNIGAQVNAISRSGGNDFHGNFYDFFNADPLNARNFFDTENGNGLTPLTSSTGQPVILCPANNPRCLVGGTPTASAGRPFNVRNDSGGKDSFTLNQFGLTLGGPIRRDKMFFFVSAERQILNASQETSFAVPTLEQRGFDNSGATGLFRDRFATSGGGIAPVRLENQNLFGASILSLFPFPNNPSGVYGRNTFTQTLPASGRGTVASAKIDYNGRYRDRQQSFTARYNFTEDERDIPAAGGAIFASLRPEVRTQNFSTFLNSELSNPNSLSPVFNQLRLSYGRTRLDFQELRDRNFLISSTQNFQGGSFLLNAPLIQNTTLPPSAGVPNTGIVTLVQRNDFQTTEQVTGPLGQVIIGGFSPVGVDVFNFPQSRVNNTYQVADALNINTGAITYVFGTDIRRTELNSNLPRNARPLATFFGAPALQNNPALGGLVPIPESRGIPFIEPALFAAAGLPSGFFQALAASGNETGNIGLRYYQLNFFGQEQAQLTRNLSLSLGVRYEYNTPAREVNDRIESTFSLDPRLSPGVGAFVGNRTQIYEPDRNNIAPRLGVAWSPKIFSDDYPTVFRGGVGVYYDQILGAVVSQSRNVFPNFIPLNLGSVATVLANANQTGTNLGFVRPQELRLGRVIPGTGVLGSCIFPVGVNCQLDPTTGSPFLITSGINTLNPIFSTGNPQLLGGLINALRRDLPDAFNFTLPTRRLEMPMAYHYSYTVEQQLPHNMVLSVAYVGTTGRNLLRFTSPNNGSNVFPIIGSVVANAVNGPTGVPGPAINGGINLPPFRPLTRQLGPISVFQTTGRSRYDSFQAQLRGRFLRRLQYQTAYTYSASFDNVSDVFDLAGAPALPQNSQTFRGEYSRSNFDVPHRLSYNLIWDVPGIRDFQIASTGQFQSGQPYTINSILDINTDGNLTDRLNTRQGLLITDSGQQPIQLAPGVTNTRSLLAPIGVDGAVRRNDFRAGNFALINLTVIKKFSFTENQGLSVRMDVFNLGNRNNFGIPVRILEAPGFGNATETVTPGRRIQFALKYSF